MTSSKTERKLTARTHLRVRKQGARQQNSPCRVKILIPAIGIVIGHAGLPRALVRAALSIVPSKRALWVVSNGDRAQHEVDEELRRISARYPDAPLIIFADMYGTSCCRAGMRLKDIRPDARIVCGVNLPMLVRFLQYRTSRTLPQLIRLMQRTAREEARRI